MKDQDTSVPARRRHHGGTPGRVPSNPVTSADITRALRILYPQVRLRTDTLPGGQFKILLPVVSAERLGARPGDSDTAAGWLTRHLGRPVTITGVTHNRKTSIAHNAVITLTVDQPGGGQ